MIPCKIMITSDSTCPTYSPTRKHLPGYPDCSCSALAYHPTHRTQSFMQVLQTQSHAASSLLGWVNECTTPSDGTFTSIDRPNHWNTTAVDHYDGDDSHSSRLHSLHPHDYPQVPGYTLQDERHAFDSNSKRSHYLAFQKSKECCFTTAATS